MTSVGEDRRPTILVVDDIPEMRDMMEVFLARAGRIVKAGDGETALAHVRNDPPALVIADLDMPGMDGAALCSALKSNPETGSVPVIILLPGESDDERARAIRAGADDVTPKPLHRSELLENAKRMMVQPVARGLPRVAFDEPVTILLGRRTTVAPARNLSRGGIFLATDLLLGPEAEVRLRFRLPEIERLLSPTATVAWRTSPGDGHSPGFGMRFVELDSDSARCLDDFVYERTPSVRRRTPPVPQSAAV